MSKLIILTIKIPVKLTKTSDYQSTMLPVALSFDPLIEHQEPPLFIVSLQCLFMCVT